MLRKVSSGVIVDNDAIAAAVAAALTIPTTAEIATAVETALTIPTAGEIATAVAAEVPDSAAVQAAAEAAITAQTTTLAAAIAGGGFDTLHDMIHGDGSATLGNIWRSCVTAIADKTADLTTAIVTTSGLAASIAAIPTAAENATAVAAPSAATIATASATAVGSLLNPSNTGPTKVASMTGATSYQILAASGGNTHVLYGYEISISLAFGSATVTWQSNGVTLTEAHAVPANSSIVVAPGSREVIRSAASQDLTLLVSESGAVVTLTYWGTTRAN